jgi:hypothetical protein
MTKEELKEYIVRYLSNGDEDAFHSLIEAGESSLDLLADALSSDTTEGIVEVLKEIRTKRVTTFLQNRLRSVSTESEWKIFAEALTYQADLGEVFFKDEKKRLEALGRVSEAKYCESFFKI